MAAPTRSRRHLGVGREHLGSTERPHESAGTLRSRDGVRQCPGARRALRGTRARARSATPGSGTGTRGFSRPPRARRPATGHAMAYDSARGRIVLFGGCRVAGLSRTPGSGTGLLGREDARHEPVSPHVPRDGLRQRAGTRRALRGERRHGFRSATPGSGTGHVGPENARHESVASRHHAMAYDSARGRVVLFGGFEGGYTLSPIRGNGTGIHGSNGRRPRVRRPAPAHAMAYDSARGRVVLFGGFDRIRFFVTIHGSGMARVWAERAPPGNPLGP